MLQLASFSGLMCLLAMNTSGSLLLSSFKDISLHRFYQACYKGLEFLSWCPFSSRFCKNQGIVDVPFYRNQVTGVCDSFKLITKKTLSMSNPYSYISNCICAFHILRSTLLSLADKLPMNKYYLLSILMR